MRIDKTIHHKTKLFAVGFYIFLTVLCLSDRISAQPLILQDSSGNEIGRYEKSAALVILSAQYNPPWTPLSGLNEFGKDLTNTLESLDFDVVTLENPKGKEFHESLLEFFNNYGRYVNSRVLVYYAGHCGRIKTKFGVSNAEYLIPTDAPSLKKDPIWFRENALSMYRLDHYLRKLGAKHILSIFEGCSKGLSLEKDDIIYSGPIKADKFEPSREVIFINSQNGEERKIRQGLIEGLKGAADLWRDGTLTTLELVAYLNKGIAEERWGRVKMVYGKLKGYALKQGTLIFPLTSKTEKEIEESKPDLPKDVAELEIEEPEPKIIEEEQSNVFSHRGETIINWPDEEVGVVGSQPPITEHNVTGSNELVAFEDPETLY
jgi:hypothetical protein